MRTSLLLGKKILPLFVLGGMLFAGWFINPSQIENRWDVCWSQFLFHLDCPGCGMTRAFLSLAKGHFLEAIHYNAASPLIYFFFLIYFIELGLNLRKERFSLNIPLPWVKIYSILLVLVLFGQWVIKLGSKLIN